MKKIVGQLRAMAPSKTAPAPTEVMLAFCGSCAALAIIGLLHELVLQQAGLPLLMAPFGASAVLVYGAFRSPLAQPRNVVGGHVLSAFIGVSVFQLTGDAPMLAVSLAVPLAIAAMHLTGTLHPPGGATAFLAAAGGGGIHELGYLYVLAPCAAGSLLMVALALVINNIPKRRQYPLSW